MAAALSAQNSQATTTTSTTPAAPIFSTPKDAPTVMQGGSASRFPKGWNPATGYGMPPDFYTSQANAQFNASATQPITPQPDPSATQSMGSQQDASAVQPNAHGTWSPQMAAQVNASAPLPMTPQQHLTIMLQPRPPTEILRSQFPH